ncbi:NAD(P)/FAD-dependent oxidoreductase [Streptomyces liangshanensis]|uniref:FAD-dependent oxidoreductase n=1 Tax=Streptomyces liangshanensis TaxID=2717324 RepID=A0A6G9GZR5_9ACTN|nr:FAD-dependent oxidoreductase [Streptomyces liangshanensis]QIQ03377.1 FAD-dependent oxidoreductase [Streptomyces liangshanensis]
MTPPRTPDKNLPSTHHVVVLGAGYGGLMTALRLAPHTRVTLVDPAGHFTERVRLHERASGRPDVTHPLDGFLHGTGIIHVAARATRLDLAAREVHTDNGQVLHYDRLVHALGSRTAPAPTPVEGTPSNGGRAYTTESAAELHKRLLEGPGTLAVVGGGLTGVELATELAESHPGWRIGLHTEGIVGASLSNRGRAHVRTALAARGVRTEEGHRVASPDAVDADVVLWAASMVPATGLATAAGIAVDRAGRITVDTALRSVSHPEVYAVGDSAAAHTEAAGPLRMACATALPTGAHAAVAITADLRGEEPPPLRFGYLLQCVSLGRQDGVIQPVRADDSPRARILTGRPAAYVKEQIVLSTVRMLHLASRHPSALRYVPGIG